MAKRLRNLRGHGQIFARTAARVGWLPLDCLGRKSPNQEIARRMLAHWLRCLHYACMAIQITIRDVPEKVRDELASRAALQGKSMQEYLRAELERLASRPSPEAWLKQVRRRKRASQARVSARQILDNRDADRR